MEIYQQYEPGDNANRRIEESPVSDRFRPPHLMRFLHYAFLVLMFALAASPAPAAELELRYGVLERVIGQQIFSQEGRLYVRGNQNTKCQYAFLESPKIGSDGGRLKFNAKFSGKTALGMMGRCVGLGDSFEFTMTSVPVVVNGNLMFSEVNITTPRDSYYIRRVREALARSFSKDLKIDVREQAFKLMNQMRDDQIQAQAAGKTVFIPELSTFQLGGIRIAPEGLVLVVDFKLVVR
jgi:hypothetical protein